MERRTVDQYCRPHALDNVPSTKGLWRATRPCTLKKCAPKAARVFTPRPQGRHTQAPAGAKQGRACIARRYSAHSRKFVICSSQNVLKSRHSRRFTRALTQPVRRLRSRCHSGQWAASSRGHSGSSSRSQRRSPRTTANQVWSACRIAHNSGWPALHSDASKLSRALLANISSGKHCVSTCTAGAATW